MVFRVLYYVSAEDRCLTRWHYAELIGAHVRRCYRRLCQSSKVLYPCNVNGDGVVKFLDQHSRPVLRGRYGSLWRGQPWLWWRSVGLMFKRGCCGDSAPDCNSPAWKISIIWTAVWKMLEFSRSIARISNISKLFRSMGCVSEGSGMLGFRPEACVRGYHLAVLSRLSDMRIHVFADNRSPEDIEANAELSRYLLQGFSDANLTCFWRQMGLIVTWPIVRNVWTIERWRVMNEASDKLNWHTAERRNRQHCRHIL